MQNEENVQALRQTLDLVRMCSIFILLLNYYVCCHGALIEWGIRWPYVDRIVINLSSGMIFLKSADLAKVVSLALLGISMLGQKGKKNDKLTWGTSLYFLSIGLLLFFVSTYFLKLDVDPATIGILYVAITSLGYLSVMQGVARMIRILKLKSAGDIFNERSEQFPQEEELMENEYSINLPTLYHFQNKVRKGWINVVNPARALLVAGTPGSR